MLPLPYRRLSHLLARHFLITGGNLDAEAQAQVRAVIRGGLGASLPAAPALSARIRGGLGAILP